MHLERRPLQVNIAPLEREQLALAHPGGERQHIQGFQSLACALPLLRSKLDGEAFGQVRCGGIAYEDRQRFGATRRGRATRLSPWRPGRHHAIGDSLPQPAHLSTSTWTLSATRRQDT